MKIGFFDSGLGGLTVFNKAIKNIHADYIYIADNKNTPYGIKPKEEVIEYILKSVKILVDLKCDIIVIACNTATSIAIKTLRAIYNDVCIIGTEPAVKVAVNENYLNKKILVSATTMTLKEEKLNNLIKNLEAEDFVEKVALDKLVEFAENGEVNNDIIKEYLISKFLGYNLNEFSHLVLGCTHFPLFEKHLKEILPQHIQIVDGSDGIVKNIRKKVEDKNLKENNISTVKLLLTNESNNFVENFKRISGVDDIVIEVV